MTVSDGSIASAGFRATLDQGRASGTNLAEEMQGWAKRFGAILADTESRRFIQGFALSTILHQDPRYFPSQKHSLTSRGWFAVTSDESHRNEDGQRP
jgi:hypothetical protein